MEENEKLCVPDPKVYLDMLKEVTREIRLELRDVPDMEEWSDLRRSLVAAYADLSGWISQTLSGYYVDAIEEGMDYLTHRTGRFPKNWPAGWTLLAFFRKRMIRIFPGKLMGRFREFNDQVQRQMTQRLSEGLSQQGVPLLGVWRVDISQFQLFLARKLGPMVTEKAQQMLEKWKETELKEALDSISGRQRIWKESYHLRLWIQLYLADPQFFDMLCYEICASQGRWLEETEKQLFPEDT